MRLGKIRNVLSIDAATDNVHGCAIRWRADTDHS
jgi:hypothetical protein